MRSTLFQVSGEPADGDVAVVAYTTPRGGMSYAIYHIKGEKVTAELVNGEPTKVVVPGDSPAAIAEGLVNAINHVNSEFCRGEFHAVAHGALLIVTGTDAVSDATFIAQVQGTGTGKIEQL
jgi:ethanolamine utilization microcompartment shell protein EutL